MTDAADALIHNVNLLSDTFDELCQIRLQGSEAEVFEFIGEDIFTPYVEMLADIANMSRKQFIKLMLIQDALEKKLDGQGDSEGKIEMGTGAFKPNG